jgi:hypothetical protein
MFRASLSHNLYTCDVPLAKDEDVMFAKWGDGRRGATEDFSLGWHGSGLNCLWAKELKVCPLLICVQATTTVDLRPSYAC